MGSNFVQSLKTAEAVFERYKEDQPKWWKRMDGTPILNDVAVRMAQAFQLPDGYDYSDLAEAQDTIDHLEAKNAKLVAALKDCYAMAVAFAGQYQAAQGLSETHPQHKEQLDHARAALQEAGAL